MLLTVAGLHDPVIPFAEVPGKVGTEPPAQTDSVVPNENVGVMLGLTVTVNEVFNAH